MLSRATCVSLCFLFTILTLKGKTAKVEDEEVYCDKAYRSKYIVSTSLFSLPPKSNKTYKYEGKNMILLPINVSDTTEQYSDYNKNDSDEDSVEIFEQGIKNRKLSINKHWPSRKKSLNKMIGRPIEGPIGMRKALRKPSRVPMKPRKQQQPVLVTVNAQVNLSMNHLDYVEGGSVASHRRKRETWDGSNTCMFTRRIIGGTSVNSIEDVPYIVFIDSGCAGTIIGDVWILTAAHCIGPNSPKFVYGGSKKLFTGCRHKIKKIFVHPGYNAKTYKADITLLRLYQPFIFSPAIKPISMENEPPSSGICGVISGWGSTKVGGKMEYYLRTTMLPIIPRKKCQMFPNIGEDQFCAGFQDAHTDSCQGDSGGPFIVNNLLVGIVSFGYKCAMREIPGVYTNVPFYRKWVENITGIE